MIHFHYTHKQKGKLSELSVVIPCYNEQDNIKRLLTQLSSTIPKYAQKWEFIFVDDGSIDKTGKILDLCARKNPKIRVVHQQNLGFGAALNTGLQEANFEWVFYTDADLQLDIREISTFVKLTHKADMIIGYRIKRAEGLKRSILAWGMKVWNHIMLGFPLSIRDIDCAFKLMKRKVITSVGNLQSKGNLVTTELLMKALMRGYVIEQIGVQHYNRMHGKSKCGGLRNVWLVLVETGKLLTVRLGLKHALSS